MRRLNSFDPGYTATRGLGCFISLLWLAFWGGVIAVAWHFIAKFW